MKLRTPFPTQVAGLLTAALLLAVPAFAQEVELEQRTITFWSDGARLKGDVFKPSDIKAGEKLPGILLIHGWGGNRSNLNKLAAPEFARRGFIVMTFDLRSWGESEGFLLSDDALPASNKAERLTVEGQHFRSIVNPEKMLEDTRAAIAWLVGEPDLQADNIGIWGTSLGGGLALVTAAGDSRIKALVTQVGAVNSKANFAMIPDALVATWETQRARGEITPYPGAESVIPGFKGYADMIAVKQYDPAAYWDRLNVPTLIIDAANEELFNTKANGQALHESLQGRVENRYLVIPGTHYDLYHDEGQAIALKAAQDWFTSKLK